MRAKLANLNHCAVFFLSRTCQLVLSAGTISIYVFIYSSVVRFGAYMLEYFMLQREIFIYIT